MDSGVGFMLLGCALVACGGEASNDGRSSPSNASGGSSSAGGAPSTSPCDSVRFEDPALDAAVRMELRKPSGELSAAELATARTVRVQGAHSLAGLECLTHLQFLVTSGGDYSDLTPLAGLVDLRMVTAIGSDVRSLAPLVGLPKLETVGFSHGFVSDLTPLAEIPSLTWVSIYGEVSDVSPLAKLPNLEILELYGNPLSDVSALGIAPALKRLVLDSTQVVSVDIDAPALEDLSVADTPLTDLAPVRRFLALQKFSAARSAVDDISALADLTQLRDVDLRNSRVRDLSPLLRPLPAGVDCAPLSAEEALLEPSVTSDVVPKLCAIGWFVWTGAAPGQSETCRQDCVRF